MPGDAPAQPRCRIDLRAGEVSKAACVPEPGRPRRVAGPPGGQRPCDVRTRGLASRPAPGTSLPAGAEALGRGGAGVVCAAACALAQRKKEGGMPGKGAG